MNNHYKTHEENLPRSYNQKPKKPVKLYKQFYRKAWEQIPEFREWLTSIPGERSKAYCKICDKSLHAHRLSLTKHTVSLKHMRMAQKKAQERNEACYYGSEMRVTLDGQVEVSDDQTVDYNTLAKEELICEEGTMSGTAQTIEEHHLEQLRQQQRQEEEDTIQQVVHPQVIYATEDDQHIILQEKDISPSDGVSLIKIVPKKKGERPPITTHVLDISKGLPVAGLAVSLYHLYNGRWLLIKENYTDGDGRCMDLNDSVGIQPGRYKLHFDTERYFIVRHQPTFYPFVEVVFDICNPSDHHHVPLLLGPYGYTTYRGS